MKRINQLSTSISGKDGRFTYAMEGKEYTIKRDGCHWVAVLNHLTIDTGRTFNEMKLKVRRYHKTKGRR